jgi:hypothetical protein
MTKPRHARRVPVFRRAKVVVAIMALASTGLVVGLSGISAGHDPGYTPPTAPGQSTNPGNGYGDAGGDHHHPPPPPTGLNLNQSPDEAAASGLCTLWVPPNPLTATGLAVPYVLSDGCDEANPAESAFVQATILAPTGQVAVYSPLIITAGSTPLAAPVVPDIPAGFTVGIWFGFDGMDLHLVGPGAASCVNGEPGSDFGQYAYCNAPAFFGAADAAVAAHTLKIPPLGLDFLGQPCPAINSFTIVDQDPNDNVQTQYLVDPGGRTGQYTVGNAQAHPDATPNLNPSDNVLLSDFVNPAIGCFPWKVQNLADQGGSWTPVNAGPPVASLALDQLQASFDEVRATESAVPLVDEMTLAGAEPPAATQQNVAKTNLYRAGVDQSPINTAGFAAPDEVQSGAEATWCADLAAQFPTWLQAHYGYLIEQSSPVPGEGSNLYTFLAERFVVTWSMALPRPGVLPTCTQDTGLADPIATFVNGDGVAVAVNVAGTVLPPGVNLAGTTTTNGDAPVVPTTTTTTVPPTTTTMPPATTTVVPTTTTTTGDMPDTASTSSTTSTSTTSTTDAATTTTSVPTG